MSGPKKIRPQSALSGALFDTMGGAMLVRLTCGVLLAVAVSVPGVAKADCTNEVSKLVSRDTEKLSTRFHRVSKRIELQGRNPSLVAEECRIARQLSPMLEDQIVALKQSGCSKDPNAKFMIADIVRGHEDELAVLRRTAAKAECR